MQLQQEKMVEEEEDECEEKKAKELAATFERGRAEAYIYASLRPVRQKKACHSGRSGVVCAGQFRHPTGCCRSVR
jgi:transposase